MSWCALTVRVAPAWAGVNLDELGLAQAMWTTLVVPLPPVTLAIDPALATGQVAIDLDGAEVVRGAGPEPGPAIGDALGAAAHRWLTPALVATLCDLAIPLETLERWSAAVPAATQLALFGRLLAERIALADLPLLAEVCVGEVLGLRLQGRDPAALEPAALDDGLELACRLAVRRRISLGLLGRGRTDVIRVTGEVAAAIVLGRSPPSALVAAIEAAGARTPAAVIAVPAPLRRGLRALLAPVCPELPVVAAEELIVAGWRVAATIDALPAQ